MEKLYCLENEHISIQVNSLGAELRSYFHKQSEREYIWQRGVAWPKSSPVLFPIIGSLIDNSYTFEGEKYELPRHGFAREQSFDLKQSSDTHLSFELKSSEKTRVVYPFDFELTITYMIMENVLTVEYEVRNKDSRHIWFSIGAHPAFNLPFHNSLSYSDYSIRFENDTSLKRYALNSSGIVKNVSENVQVDNGVLKLNKEMFTNDAWVLNSLSSKNIYLESPKDKFKMRFGFEDYSFFGIWAAKGADFICLEPWCGVADFEDHTGDFTKKKGVETLSSNESWKRSWIVEVSEK
ncbi:MAG: aldose 1-epimerase family protein [Leadbetterella sp.]